VILTRVRAQGSVTVDDLATQCGVSLATVRRDVAELAAQGQLRRVHGGVTLLEGKDPDASPGFEAVAQRDTPLKLAVARRAARLVADGATVALDIGTTTQLVARELRGRPVTVVTASLAVVDVLRHDTTVELIVLGGVLRRSYHSLVGVLTEDALRQIHAQVAIVGTSGLQADGRVLDSTLVEAPVKRALIAASDRSVIVADAHKLPGTGTVCVCRAGEFDTLITNRSADPEIIEAVRKTRTEVLLA